MLWLVIVLAGGVGLAACDQMHVHGGVLSYPASDPQIAGQSWWVVVVFIAAVALILLGASITDRLYRRPATARQVVQAGAWFVGSYAATAVFWHHPRVLAILLGLTWLDRVAFRPDRWPVIAFSVVLAIGGTLVEGTLAGSGAFAYHHHDFFHVPFWLPGLYLHGALLAVAVYRYANLRLAASGDRGAAVPAAA